MKFYDSFLLFGLLTGCVGEDPEATDHSDLNSIIRTTPSLPEEWDDPLPAIPDAVRSCSSGSYLLKLDSRYSDQTLASLESSWNEWKQVLGEHFTVQVQIKDLSNDQAFEACVIKVILHDPPPTYLGWTVSWLVDGKKLSTSRIWIPEGLGEVRHQVSAHEFGHALGLPHNQDPASVMDPASYPDSVITCEDKKNLCAVWGCIPGCE